MTAVRPSRATQQIVIARSGAHCEVAFTCGAQGAYLPNVIADIHHRHPAKSGGSRLAWIHAPSNLLAVCRNCHRFAESRRVWSLERGLLIASGVARALTNVVDCRHGRVLLDDAGTFTYAVTV